MKSNRTYYVVDSISESFVGSFEAINDKMALTVFKKSFFENDKIKNVFEGLILLRGSDDSCRLVCETYDEALSDSIEVKYERAADNLESDRK